MEVQSVHYGVRNSWEAAHCLPACLITYNAVTVHTANLIVEVLNFLSNRLLLLFLFLHVCCDIHRVLGTVLTHHTWRGGN